MHSMFFLIAIAVILLANAYVGLRLIVPANLAAPWSHVAWAAMLVFAVLPPITMYLRFTRLKPVRKDFLAWIAFFDMGFLNVLFLLILLRDLAWLIALAVQKSITIVYGWSNPEINVVPHSQGLQISLAETNIAVLIAAGLFMALGFYQARRPKIMEIEIPIKDLPADLNGFRLVQISDLHVGPTIGRKFVAWVIDEVNRLRPDVVVFTGDVADGKVAHLRDDVAPLAKLSAEHGAFFVTGNHEYYSGAEPWVNEMRRLGFTVLMNEHRLLRRGNGRILIAGVPDFGAHAFSPEHASDPDRALAGAPPSDVKILLAHQPRSILAASTAGFDLQLSGHTHGGQIIPWNWLVPLQQIYVSGLHKHNGTWIYVNNGTGYWGPPIRLGAPAEVTVVRLVAG